MSDLALDAAGFGLLARQTDLGSVSPSPFGLGVVTAYRKSADGRGPDAQPAKRDLGVGLRVVAEPTWS
jgi:hypothetical protein